MHWDDPHWLWFLWLLPAVGAVMGWARRRQRQAAERFAEATLLGRLVPPRSTTREWLKAALLLLGLACLIVSLARPRWGQTYQQVTSRGVDLFVLLDVSRSMLAQDVTPNRLERAKSDIRDLLVPLEGDRVGLIVFAGAAVVAVPLTTDQAFFLATLDQVDPSSAPRGGSLIGDAIRKALSALPSAKDRDQVLVLITDGEDHDSFPLEAARLAAERGVQVFTVGLGDASVGHPIPLPDPQGPAEFVQQDGREVLTKMDEKLLTEIALATGGAYVPARTRAYDLGAVYEDRLAQLTRGTFSTERRQRYTDRFQIFLAAGFVLLLLESIVPRYPRRITSPGGSSFPGGSGLAPGA